MNFIRPKHAGADCSYCRHSQTQKAGKGYSIICTLGRSEDAKDCPQFTDSRKPSKGAL